MALPRYKITRESIVSFLPNTIRNRMRNPMTVSTVLLAYSGREFFILTHELFECWRFEELQDVEFSTFLPRHLI